jgi:hypothetical protein
MSVVAYLYRSTLGKIVTYIRSKVQEWRITRTVRRWEKLFEEVLGYPDDP